MRRYIYLIGVLYIALNVVLLLAAPYGVHLEKGADAISWYTPALSLLKHGAFVALADSTVLQTYRPPAYPVYEAFMLYIGNGNIISIIVGQIILLWLVGIITYKIVEDIFPEKGNINIEVTESDDPRSYHISSDKIKKELNFIPKYSVEDAVRDSCQAFKNGSLPNSFDDDKYFNVRTMKKLKVS